WESWLYHSLEEGGPSESCQTNPATTYAHIQDFDWELLNVCPIYDLLEHVSGQSFRPKDARSS
ncbi:hypothetical protein ACQP3C_30445, partial [Escherichia coli]